VLYRVATAIMLVTAGGCASGSPLVDAGPALPDAERPPETIVDAAWLAEVVLPEPLGPLPAHQAVPAGDLETHDSCENCHGDDPDSAAMRDEGGRTVSPDALWNASMMALSSRDPYWLAVFSHEVAENPNGEAYLEELCTRCHAPAVAATGGGPITFAMITTEETPEAHLARDGVTCTLCHAITAEGLGEEASFVGGFVIDDMQRLFGPHEMPDAANMRSSTGYEAAYGAHSTESALCGTCHTVITRALGDDGTPVGPPFPEQVPYLEWRNSVFSTEGTPGPDARSCGDCHVPLDSVDGAPLMTPISSQPPGLPARAPYGRHTFFGGNAYMLQLMAENLGWVGAEVTAADLMEASEATEAMLQTSASVELSVELDGEVLHGTVRVENHTGHRLPTGYPSRRVIVRFTVLDASGSILWQSGRPHVQGGLLDRAGDRLDYPGAYMPHFDVIVREDQVQIYEGVMGDRALEPTRSLLQATGYLKDSRILPRGWSEDHPDADLTGPIAIGADPDFLPGEDTVRYRLLVPEGAATVRVELVFQSVPAPAVEHLFDLPTPATARMDEMRRARPDRGRVIAMDEVSLQ